MNHPATALHGEAKTGVRRECLIGLALLAGTLAAFWPVGGLGFIKYDDYGPTGYIVDNPHIQQGINWQSIRWAFTTTRANNYHPVTWLSHMLDCRLYGLNPAGHHWTNLGLHLASTLLLFVLLRVLTGAVWRSALVAALFGVHPLHVQSVAWISERKDVLSGFFFMLTLLAYARYARKAEGGRRKAEDENQTSARRSPPSAYYFLALGLFALGLMSKPMLVTLPLVLLLLDGWPLKRVSGFEFRVSSLASGVAGSGLRVLQPSTPNPPPSTPLRLLWEKVPFLVLSAGSSAATLWGHQQTAGALITMESLPWYSRLGHVLVSYVTYLGKIFWPVNLSIFYPYHPMPAWEVIGSGLLLIGVSVLVVRWRSIRPWLLIGWCWFLITLVPVIGLVQVGFQAMADRYMYLPAIGVFLAVAWGLGELGERSPGWRAGMTLGAIMLTLGCVGDTRRQLGYWRDSVTLFRHALEVTGDSALGHFYLAGALWGARDVEGAARHYEAVLRFAPDFEDGHYSLGYMRLLQQKYSEAEIQFREVLRLNPGNPFARKYLGDTLCARGDFADARAEYATALELRPGDEVIRQALAAAERQLEAEKELAALEEALKARPTAEGHSAIAALQAARGDFRQALQHYRAALQLTPDDPALLNNLAWLLATCPDSSVRDGAEAVRNAGRACELTQFRQPILVGTLGAAYAEAGRFDDAIKAAQQAIDLATAAGQKDLVTRNEQLLGLYRAGRPYHE